MNGTRLEKRQNEILTLYGIWDSLLESSIDGLYSQKRLQMLSDGYTREIELQKVTKTPMLAENINTDFGSESVNAI